MTRDNDFRRLMEEFRPHVSHRHADGLADLDLLTYALLYKRAFYCPIKGCYHLADTKQHLKRHMEAVHGSDNMPGEERSIASFFAMLQHRLHVFFAAGRAGEASATTTPPSPRSHPAVLNQQQGLISTDWAGAANDSSHAPLRHATEPTTFTPTTRSGPQHLGPEIWQYPGFAPMQPLQGVLMRDNGPLEWETPMGYSDDQLPGLSGTFPSDPWTSSGYQQTDIGVAPEGNHARGVVFGLHMDSRQSISADAAPQSGTLMDYQLGLDNCSGEPVPSNEQPPSDNVGQSFGW